MQSFAGPLRRAFRTAWGGPDWHYEPPTEATSTASSKLSLRLALAVVVLLPPVLLLLNNSWVLLRPNGYLDPHLYTGYFLDLKGHLTTYVDAYYGSRLPWVLTGAIAHSLLPPEPANYALRLLLLYGGMLSLFFTVLILYKNPVAACLSAVFLGTHSYFLVAIGWDYIDGPGVVLTLFTLLCLAGGARTRQWEAFMFGAGAGMMAMVSTQAVLVILLPFLVAWYVMLNQSGNRLPLLRSFAHLVAGAATTFFTLCVINRPLAGSPWYFTGQWDAVFSVNEARDNWKLADYTWVKNATWLAYPLVFVVAGTVVAVVAWLKGWRRQSADWGKFGAATASLGVMVAVCGFFVVLEPLDYYYLEYLFYASYLIPFVSLGAAALFARALEHAAPKEQITVVAVAIVALLLPYRLAFLPVESCGPSCFGKMDQIALLLLVSGVLLVTAVVLQRVRLLLIPALVVFGALNLMITDHRHFSFPPDGAGRQDALLVYDANDVIERYDERNRLRFWYSSSDPRVHLFTAISSLHLYTYNLVGTDFPDWTDEDNAKHFLHQGERLVIMSSQPGQLAEADKTLATLNLATQKLGEASVSRGGAPIYLTFVSLVAKP